MLHKNTSWSSIYIFSHGNMFSFAFIGEMDFSFTFGQHFQQSELHCNVFTLNQYRGRSWASDT